MIEALGVKCALMVASTARLLTPAAPLLVLTSGAKLDMIYPSHHCRSVHCAGNRVVAGERNLRISGNDKEGSEVMDEQ